MAAKFAKQRWVVVFEDMQDTCASLYNATELREVFNDYPAGLRVVSVKKEKK